MASSDSGSSNAPSPLRTGFTEHMSSSVYSPVRTGFREKRPPPPSPVLHSDARPWRWRSPMPSILRFYHLCIHRFGKRKVLLSILSFATVFSLFFSATHIVQLSYTVFTRHTPTLVFQREDLRRVWEWEIASGHYPSTNRIPEEIGLTIAPRNPALPPPQFRRPHGPIYTECLATGAARKYVERQNTSGIYPPRPVAGGVANLDMVMNHCDFSRNKYVRDCLEFLRLGGDLGGTSLRREGLDESRYIYLEEGEPISPGITSLERAEQAALARNQDTNAGLNRKPFFDWESPLELPPTRPYYPYGTLPEPCDEESPRLFHMFWAGPFTDKPYVAILSFLFTQNLGLHLSDGPHTSSVCRPQFWLWINPGPAASVPNPTAVHDMYESLKSNPWSAPFLHSRFRDVIKFKLWNTTEQLDGVPELKNEWRPLKSRLFTSVGKTMEVPDDPVNGTENGTDMSHRLGSKSKTSLDKMSTVLSDMARFVLCHRFGGVYLDADTVLLRDWEELWGWKGAFAYRWSRLEYYNTAVLHLNKGSALGSFLFRTALKNGLDFHPMTVSRYTKDAYLEDLLLRLPDALFDPAWLSVEHHQRDRPPQPVFDEFAHFFETPAVDSAQPHALGFDGFFKGAYSYHYHNSWWTPFDPSRNWPDLGERFIDGERAARAALGPEFEEARSSRRHDKRDLDWATVLKRTFEAYLRGERPNMYGEWIDW
ncbi:hypothetical protein PLICRDRAFT_36083 [Plicaturopsis crispa FD-325 SS-3]|nr:hypothetical protein PLICRDRAFT_36083 [Plicaturopsis crispa FD-325 SS-3]